MNARAANRLTVSEEDVCRFVGSGSISEVIDESTN